jgi:hypothetical protein
MEQTDFLGSLRVTGHIVMSGLQHLAVQDGTQCRDFVKAGMNVNAVLTALWITLPSVMRRFRRTYCLHRQGTTAEWILP